MTASCHKFTARWKVRFFTNELSYPQCTLKESSASTALQSTQTAQEPPSTDRSHQVEECSFISILVQRNMHKGGGRRKGSELFLLMTQGMNQIKLLAPGGLRGSFNKSRGGSIPLHAVIRLLLAGQQGRDEQAVEAQLASQLLLSSCHCKAFD